MKRLAACGRVGGRRADLHVQRLLSLCGLVLGAVAHHGVALGQVEVECDQGAVLHAQGPQSGAIDLRETARTLVTPTVHRQDFTG